MSNLPKLSSISYVGDCKAALLKIAAICGSKSRAVVNYVDAKKQVADYAEATNISARLAWHRIKREKKCPTALCATPIESDDNRRWGVLVLDSSNDVEVIDTDSKKFRNALGKLMKVLRENEVIRMPT